MTGFFPLLLTLTHSLHVGTLSSVAWYVSAKNKPTSQQSDSKQSSLETIFAKMKQYSEETKEESRTSEKKKKIGYI